MAHRREQVKWHSTTILAIHFQRLPTGVGRFAVGPGRLGMSQPQSQVAAGYSYRAKLRMFGEQSHFSDHRQRRGGAMSGDSTSSSPPTLGWLRLSRSLNP